MYPPSDFMHCLPVVLALAGFPESKTVIQLLPPRRPASCGDANFRNKLASDWQSDNNVQNLCIASETPREVAKPAVSCEGRKSDKCVMKLNVNDLKRRLVVICQDLVCEADGIKSTCEPRL